MVAPETKPSRKFRTDIQGLRALAVSMVVLFHLFPSKLTGGYIGVDIFFVISGFLITGHLLREVERTGTVKLTEFWARRIRRLLPAAFLVLIVSAIAALIWLPATVVTQNLKEIGLAAVYALNWGLAADSVDYLASDNAATMAQHYWSLSVEEQFYIVWPIIVVLVMWLASKNRRISKRVALGSALVVVFALSLAFSITETSTSQASAYFVTTTRAWEFAAGGIMAVLPTLAFRNKIPALGKQALSWLACAAILYAAVMFDAATPFPGHMALIPVIGTALLLWLGDSDSTWAPQFFAKAGPVQYLGDISYSVYLWHWPPIALYMAIYGRTPTFKAAAAILIMTVIAAAISYRYVETPLRKGPGILHLRLPTFGFMVAGFAVVGLLTFVPAQNIKHQQQEILNTIAVERENPDGCFGANAITNECASPYAYTKTITPSVTAADHYSETGTMSNPDKCTKEKVVGELEANCVLNVASSDAPKIMLVGDSHAAEYLSTFEHAGALGGWNVESKTRNSCSGFLSLVPNDTEQHDRCAQWGEETFKEILADSSIDVVVVANRTIQHPKSRHSELASERLGALKAAGKKLIFMHDVPGTKAKWPEEIHGPLAPECVERSGKDDACSWKPPQVEDWFMDLADQLHADVIDPWEILCSADGKCHTIVGGTIVYSDEDHLANSFAISLAPWMKNQLEPLVDRKVS